MSRRRQEGDVTFSEETDRVYLGTSDPVVVHDPVMDRRLIVTKEGSTSTVVWNPWSTKGDQMADMAPGEWSGFVCVETANAADDARTIPPGGRHRLSAVISVEAGSAR
jgi:D-hexose-6-phosphate mutarotase